MDFHVFFYILWNISLRKPIKNTWNDDFNIIIHNFDHFFQKFRLAAGSLPGVTLGGERASGGPLRGG